MGLFGRKTVIAIQILLNLRLHSLWRNGEYSISRAASSRYTNTVSTKPTIAMETGKSCNLVLQISQSRTIWNIFCIYVLVVGQHPRILTMADYHQTMFYRIFYHCFHSKYFILCFRYVLCSMFWSTVSPQHKNISLKISSYVSKCIIVLSVCQRRVRKSFNLDVKILYSSRMKADEGTYSQKLVLSPWLGQQLQLPGR